VTPARRPVPPRVSEKAEQQAIVDLLRLIGAKVYVLGTKRRRGDYQGTMQTPGIPDLFAFMPIRAVISARQVPHAIWVEVKTTNGRLRPEQAAFRDHCCSTDMVHLTGGADYVSAQLKAWGFLK
jgi:hypothetical protein